MSLDRAETGAPSRQWPGERQPTRWDVHDANESPAVTFLDRFRAALLLSDGAEEALLDFDPLIDDSENLYSPPKSVNQYTYPMALLSSVSELPPESELARLRDAFLATFKNHIFMNAVELATTSALLPPYLQLAMASISAVTSPITINYLSGASYPPTDVSSSLFVAGVSVWSVMLESDNREARLLEAVVAAALLITYGMLSADGREYRRATVLLSQVITVSARFRHSESTHFPDIFAYHKTEASEKEISMKRFELAPYLSSFESLRTTISSLMSYMLLIDVLHAVHRGLAPNYSINELIIKLPSSRYQFRNIYNSLTHGHTIPQDVRSPEDSLMLLTALLSEIIYIQRCRLSPTFTSSHHFDTTSNRPDRRAYVLRNPHAPLSSHSEVLRLHADMTAALSRWEKHFQGNIETNVVAIYYFAKMQLACAEIWELPSLAGYGEANGCKHDQTQTDRFAIPDRAIDLAWLILDQCDKSSDSESHQLSIWFPIILFMSALVIWHRLRSQVAIDRSYGTLKMLTPFRNEIARLPWPCCEGMAKTLDRLMES